MIQHKEMGMIITTLLFFAAIGCSEPSGSQSNKASSSEKSASGSASESASKPGQRQASSSEMASQGGGDPSAISQQNAPATPINASEFPRPKNAEKPMYTSDTNSILFHQPGNVEDQVQFYTQQLAKLGWKKDPSSEISDGVAFIDFTNGSLSITVTINPLREGMLTTIAQGNGISVPPSLEDDGDGDQDADLDSDQDDSGNSTDR